MYIDEKALLFLIWFAHPEIYACKMTLTSITNSTPLYLTFQEKLILCNDVFFYIFLSLLLICLSILLLFVLPPSNFAILFFLPRLKFIELFLLLSIVCCTVVVFFILISFIDDIYPLLPVSLDCPFVIALSVFSNVNLLSYWNVLPNAVMLSIQIVMFCSI